MLSLLPKLDYETETALAWFIFPIIGLCLVTVLLGLIYRKAKNKRDKDRITRIEEKQKNRKTRA
jgi:phosphate/sulfate permease